MSKTRILPAVAMVLAAAACAAAASAQQPGDGSAPARRPAGFPAPRDLGPIKPETRIHLDAAGRAAGQDFLSPLAICNDIDRANPPFKVPTLQQLDLRGGVPGQPLEATKVFDNLYFVGLRQVSAWAVSTPDGIILIDTLNNTKDAINTIEPGLRKFGLDPARIKYIVLTHGHGDHTGGAKYLAEKYGARVLMSDADWKFSETAGLGSNFDPPPKRDMVITDGQKLTLGGETLTLYLTPGHTPGTVSLLIPVTDRGRPHLAALWGGTGFNFDQTPERFKIYADSAERFARIAVAAGADIPFSNHPHHDRSNEKMDELRANPTGPNPFVMGPDAVRRFLTAYSECARSFQVQMSN